MAIFPTARPVSVSPPSGVQSPRPVSLPSAPNQLPNSVQVADSSRFVQVQSFVVTIPMEVL